GLGRVSFKCDCPATWAVTESFFVFGVGPAAKIAESIGTFAFAADYVDQISKLQVLCNLNYLSIHASYGENEFMIDTILVQVQDDTNGLAVQVCQICEIEHEIKICVCLVTIQYGQDIVKNCEVETIIYDYNKSIVLFYKIMDHDFPLSLWATHRSPPVVMGNTPCFFWLSVVSGG
ncbi:MAG: hypothetical protein HQL64_13860, partial [Magnetococcales bacterium]|nr:hypothetical protein [Magnetococcales bacterium]